MRRATAFIALFTDLFAAVPTAPALMLVAALFATVPAAPAEGRSLLDTLLGEPPDSTTRIKTAPGQGLDSLDVPEWADLGYISIADLVTRLAGGDAARVGMDGVIRPVDLTGVGRGRTSLLVNGLPAGDGVVHWDNYEWLPLRALTTLGIERGTVARAEASSTPGGGRIVATTEGAGQQPLSTVALTGGSFGHRLAELDFCRTFGKYGFHIDGADITHAGVGAFGQGHLTRGFGELTFPLAGFRTAFNVAIASGDVGSPGFSEGGLQKTAERRYSLTFDRGSGRNITRLSLLRHTSRFEMEDLPDFPAFTLQDGRWRLGFRRNIPAGAGNVGLDLAVAAEKREGVLPDANTFLSEEGVVSFTRPIAAGIRYTARLGAAQREPTGFAVEPGLRISRETSAHRLWLEAGRSTGIPAILLNQDNVATDVFGISTILHGLENLQRPESHWSFETGAVLAFGRRTATRSTGGTSAVAGTGGLGAAVAGGAGSSGGSVADSGAVSTPRAGGAVADSEVVAKPAAGAAGTGTAANTARAGIGFVAGADYTSDSPGYFSPSRGVLAFQPVTDPYWTARFDATAFWAPRTDIEFAVRAGYHAFDKGREPFEPNLTGEGSLTIRRDFFDHDLHLSATGGGELIGRRQNPDGETYPTALSGVITLTGRIKTLTLFWRTENIGGVYIESDLREQGTPVPLPGIHYRIGASLRLVD